MSNLGDFTEKDWEALSEALDAYESQPREVAISTAMVEVIGSSRERASSIVQAAMDKAKAEQAVRKRTTILLRAKVELARQAAQAAAIEAAAGKGDA